MLNSSGCWYPTKDLLDSRLFHRCNICPGCVHINKEAEKRRRRIYQRSRGGVVSG